MGRAKRRDDNPDLLEDAVDEAIKMSGGDMRETIRGLIRGAASYKEEIARTVSAGYVRRRPN